MSGNPFIEEERDKLKKSLGDFLKYHPQYMNEFIQLCADHLHQYREECKRDLEVSARMALERLMHGLDAEENGQAYLYSAPNHIKIATLLPALRLCFPKGLSQIGFPSERKLLELFLETAKQEDTINKSKWWLENNGHYDWMKMITEQTKNPNWRESLPKSAI